MIAGGGGGGIRIQNASNYPVNILPLKFYTLVARGQMARLIN